MLQLVLLMVSVVVSASEPRLQVISFFCFPFFLSSFFSSLILVLVDSVRDKPLLP